MMSLSRACFNILLKAASEESILTPSSMTEFQIIGHDNLCKIDPNVFIHMARTGPWIAVDHSYKYK